MLTSTEAHDALVNRLASRSALDSADRASVRDLEITVREVPRFARLVREGERPHTCGFILSGFAFRSKMTPRGGRQIVAALMPSDLIDLPQILLPRTDYDVDAVSKMLVGEIALARLRKLALGRPAIGRALWTDLGIEASITRELLLSNGRRDATQRIAHLLCEFAYRLGRSNKPVLEFKLPLTQEHLADMTGLTSVHVNRTLMSLRKRQLIDQSGQATQITDWDQLRRLAGFSPDYLHLDAVSYAATRQES